MKSKFQNIKNAQMTSIGLMLEEYGDFKNKSKQSGITLQELVNVCIYLYNHDKRFTNLIHENIKVSGSVI